MIKGEIITAIAMSEPGTGSDLQNIKTKASINDNEYTEKTVTFRIKPSRYPKPTDTPNYHLFTLSGSNDGSTEDLTLDNHLILEPYTTPNTDISSSGDWDQYGKLSYYQGNTLKKSTTYFPFSHKLLVNTLV